MRCPYCGSVVEPTRDASGSLWCPACGNTGRVTAAAPQPQAPALSPAVGPPAAQAKAPGQAVAALVVGIAAIVLMFPLGIVLGPVALILGVKALGLVKRMPPGTPGNGFAIAGIVMGVIGILAGITVVLAAVVFVLVSNLASEYEEPAFVFAVDGSGPGGTLTVTNVTGATALWDDYALEGDARCTLPRGTVDVGDEIVCVTDGSVVLLDYYRGDIVYTADV